MLFFLNNSCILICINKLQDKITNKGVCAKTLVIDKNKSRIIYSKQYIYYKFLSVIKA